MKERMVAMEMEGWRQRGGGFNGEEGAPKRSEATKSMMEHATT
jgi:hypothetical protein